MPVGVQHGRDQRLANVVQQRRQHQQRAMRALVRPRLAEMRLKLRAKAIQPDGDHAQIELRRRFVGAVAG